MYFGRCSVFSFLGPGSVAYQNQRNFKFSRSFFIACKKFIKKFTKKHESRKIHCVSYTVINIFTLTFYLHYHRSLLKNIKSILDLLNNWRKMFSRFLKFQTLDAGKICSWAILFVFIFNFLVFILRLFGCGCGCRRSYFRCFCLLDAFLTLRAVAVLVAVGKRREWKSADTTTRS